MSKVEMEANYELSIAKMQATIDEYTAKVDVVTKRFDSLEIRQDFISDKFKTFGSEIEDNTYRVKRLEDRTGDLKYRKLDK